MGFRELEYVCALAENKSITKTAKALGLTQPALSIFLKNLEAETGTPLFEHVGKSLVLTYAGERYLHYAREMLIMEKAMNHELSELQLEDKGCLSLTCMLPRSTFMIPETIPAFKQLYPNVSIQLYEEVAYDAIERNILDGRAFLGIVNYKPKDPHITATPLHEEELLLAVSDDHPIAKRMNAHHGDKPRIIDLNDFKNDPLIIPKNTRTAEQIQAITQKRRLDQPVFLETRNIEIALRLASEGLGITFLCDSHINFKYLPGNLVFFSTADPDAKMMLYLLYRTNSYMPSYIQKYIEMLKDYACGNL